MSIEDKIIKPGNLPLHGVKLLVNIAISLSRSEFIILQETTPAALQPKPMHIVKACFPWQPNFLKMPSRLKAILGRNPKSSSKLNNGKNIAIGGNITAVTQAKVLYMPSIKIPVMSLDIFSLKNIFFSIISSLLNKIASQSDK